MRCCPPGAAGSARGVRFTALRWAVGLGHAEIAEALLVHGADPGLPGPEGEPPLVLAARRGSLHTVRTLLRHGAPDWAPALREARLMLTVDVESELRRSLCAMYGDGHETVVRHEHIDGGVTVVVELLRDGEPFAGQDQQTGHEAIAELLEHAGDDAPAVTGMSRSRWGVGY
ncbi:ankyrin repeat domain-containing protein [Streptomyces sp. M10(2022)]